MEQITGTEHLSLLRPIRNASHMSENTSRAGGSSGLVSYSFLASWNAF